MNSYYLKYKDRKQAIDDLVAKDIIEEKDGIIEAQNGFYFDEIGIISKEIGRDENGEEIFKKLDGWHCNIYTDAILQFDNSENPVTPFRVLF